MRMGAGLSRTQQGSMLIELAVALVIATLLAAWGAHTLVNRYRDAQAQAAAVWMESLHKAVVAYVRRHGPDIQTAVDVQALVLPGFADWQAPSLGELAEAGLLSSAIPHSTPLTGSAQIAVWRSGDCPGNVCAVEALINAERALLDADGSETDQAMVAQWLLAAQGKGAAVQPARPDRIQGGALDLDNRLPGGRVLPVGTVGMAVTAEHLALWSYLRVRDPRNPEFQGQMSVEGNIAGGADASTYASHAAAQVRPDIHAKRRIDAALAQQGIPRSERRAMLKQISGTRNAAEPATHDAGFDPAALRQLLDTLQA